MNPPRKPFPSYKWQWATVTCTEGLNVPEVFLGVLRAMRAHEGSSPSSSSFTEELRVIERDTGSSVRLARTEARNLIRNSGQYWKAFDLIGDTRGEIQLTQFGRMVADGKISQAEFATTAIKMLELPNKRIGADTSEWESAGLTIKPLELILNILANLKGEQAYITLFELIRIVIPLAGEKSSIGRYMEALRLYRAKRLDLSNWPDCAPGANDKRMAREFLLFLQYYGFCIVHEGRKHLEDRFFLGTLTPTDVSQLISLKQERDTLKELRNVTLSQIPAVVERRKVLVEVTERPNQAEFRRKVLAAYGSRCLLTDEAFSTVLEAAHILPVKWEAWTKCAMDFAFAQTSTYFLIQVICA